MMRQLLDDTEVRMLIECQGRNLFASTEGIASQEDVEKILAYQIAAGLNQDYFGQENQGESN